MRNSRTVLMLLLAAGLVGLALLFASKWLKPKPPAKVAPTTVSVVVAASDLTQGSVLAGLSLKTIEWPVKSVPAGAFKTSAALNGRVLKSDAASGAVILDKMLAPVGALGGLSAALPNGMRAMTVHVDKVTGVAGFALPGNYVDVLLAGKTEMFKLSGSKHRRKGADADWLNEKMAFSKVVLEKVLVLAVAQQAGRDDRTPKLTDTVTLQVNADQAVQLDLAASVGKLSLVLRNQSDAQPLTRKALLELGILQIPSDTSAPAKVAPPRPKQSCTRVIIGAQVKQECF